MTAETKSSAGSDDGARGRARGRFARAVLLLLASAALPACTGRVPGTAQPATAAYGVGRAEPAGARPAVAESAPTPAWMEPEPPAPSLAPVPGPPAVPAVPVAPLAAAPAAPAPARYSQPSGAAPSADARERQIAILTEAVAALRQEIARGFKHSQELLEETKRLRIQVRTLREELDQSRAENQQLRAQVRTLERRLGEIRVTPPVGAGTESAQ